jgi:YD repeat-containing protein
MAEAAGVRVDVEVDGLPDELPSTVSVVAYRIIQESLTNVIRHSQADHVSVRLDRDGSGLRVTVFDPGPPRPSSIVTPSGFGIAGMTGRAQAVGGELSAGPGESGGFEVRARLPLPEAWRVRS